MSDALPGADPLLVADEEVTAAVIGEVIGDALTAPGSDDDVLIMLAGHGTNDHRLVAQDTTSEPYDATIPMAGLGQSRVMRRGMNRNLSTI